MDMNDIKAALDDIINLDIRTVVGDFAHDDKGRIVGKQGSKEMVTRINLLAGDVTTAFSEEILDDSLKEVRNFHSQREAQGLDIIRSNINTLYSLTRLIKTLDEEENSSKPSINSSTSDNIERL